LAAFLPENHQISARPLLIFAPEFYATSTFLPIADQQLIHDAA
jgi:hypothetical protein